MRIILSTLLVSLSVPSLFGQLLSEDEKVFLQATAIRLAENKQVDSWDLTPILTSLKDQRLVLLGEFNHGSREVFLLRNQLVKTLYQEHGFDLLLFESGIGELIYSDLARDSLSAQQMTYGFFSGWRTQEAVELMEYVKTAGIDIAGFDVQRTSQSLDKILTAFFSPLDVGSYVKLEEEYTICSRLLKNRKTVFGDIQARVDSLIQSYEQAYQHVLANSNTASLKTAMLTLKALENRKAYLQYMLQFKKDQDWRRRWTTRDSIMAANVSWLLTSIYPDRKALIIGHNFHIAKYNEKEAVMGAFLERDWPQQMYSIGVYAAQGQYFDNYGRTVEMQAPVDDHLDIKTIIDQLAGAIHFLPIPKQPQKGDSWLREPITIRDTFIDLNSSDRLNLAKSYDALFLLKRVSVPQKF